MISTLSIVKGSGGRAKMAKFHEKGRFVSFFFNRTNMVTLSSMLRAEMSLKMLSWLSSYRFEWYRKNYLPILRGSGVKNQYKMKKNTKNRKSNKF